MPIILLTKYIVYFSIDVFDLILGRKEPLIPPTRLMFDGPRGILNYKNNGKIYLDYYIKLCNLKPNEKMLDIGCGIGRKAVPLTKYFDEYGTYEGIDIVKVGIDWCSNNITTKYQNFNFQLADVYSKHYNPYGKYKASEYRFPFNNESFDFINLTSVFTHMLPEDMENYFSEISRVLKKEGRCLITFFLLNRESLELINAKKSSKDFKYEIGKYRTTNYYMPEDAICYDESYILHTYVEFGLKINKPIYYGSWCERKVFLGYQDIIIATKL